MNATNQQAELVPPINRGVDTRQRLIEAALEVFGEHGFNGASTRMLADRADANLAAIPYHFGSKEGLYRAAAEFIVEITGAEIMPTIEKINRALDERRITRRTALRLLHEILERFAHLVIGSPAADRWSSFVMREQLNPGAAFEILYEGIMRHLTEACANLLAIILNRSIEDPRVMVRVETILGQLLVFRASRAAVLRQLGWQDFSNDHMKLILSVVNENLDRMVGKIR